MNLVPAVGALGRLQVFLMHQLTSFLKLRYGGHTTLLVSGIQHNDLILYIL